jgi:AbrB family looped-hinge helix DNA binding protein
MGERGQVTVPKQLRDEFDIHGGDEVIVREAEGRIVIETPVTRDELAEGYRRRAAESEALEDEMAGVSHEADRHLGDGPDW